jgi:LPXTG-motif cell wall-anchored protein
MTGRYNLVVPILKTNDKYDFTGYCLNCFGYGPPIALITIGGILVGGGIVVLRRRKKKGSNKDSDKDEDQSCGTRMQRVLDAINDYQRHARIIDDVLEEARSIAAGWQLVNALEPEVNAAEDDYNSRIKYLMVLESGEGVVEWADEALMWAGGVGSGAISRLMSARAAKFTKLAEWAVKLGIPESTGVGAAVMEAKAAMATTIGDIATTFGIMAAFVGSLAYYAPKKRQTLENMYQGIVKVRAQINQFKMMLRVRQEKLANRPGDLTQDDQIKRYHEIERLREELRPDCKNELQEVNRRAGLDLDNLREARGLRPGWREMNDVGKIEDTSGLDEWTTKNPLLPMPGADLSE